MFTHVYVTVSIRVYCNAVVTRSFSLFYSKNDSKCPRHYQNHTCLEPTSTCTCVYMYTCIASSLRTRQVADTCAVLRANYRCHAGCLPHSFLSYLCHVIPIIRFYQYKHPAGAAKAAQRSARHFRLISLPSVRLPSCPHSRQVTHGGGCRSRSMCCV